MAGSTLDDLVKRWARHCFDPAAPIPEAVVPYEARCFLPLGDGLVVGSKSGHLVEVSARGECTSLAAGIPGGAHALEACPDGSGCLLVADGQGGLWRCARDGTELLELGPTGLPDRIHWVRALPGAGAVLGSREPRVWFTPHSEGKGQPVWTSLELPFIPRWCHVHQDQTRRCWLVLCSATGQLAWLKRAELGANWVPGEQRISQCVSAPLSLALVSRGEGVVLVAATIAGVEVWTARPMATWRRTSLSPVLKDQHLVQVLSVFGRDKLVAASAGESPQVCSADLETALTQESVPWRAWPLELDVVQVHSVVVDSKTSLVVISRDSQLVKLPIHDRHQVRAQLTDHPDFDSIAERHGDEGRFVRLDLAAPRVGAAQAIHFARKGGRLTVEALLGWLEAQEGLPARKASELSAALLIAVDRLDGPERVKAVARRIWEHLREGGLAQGGEDHPLGAAWLAFLQRYYLMAWTYEAKRLNLDELTEYNRGRNPCDALIYGGIVRRDGFVATAELEQPGIWALSVSDPDAQGHRTLAAATGDGGITTAELDPRAEVLDFRRRRVKGLDQDHDTPYSRVVGFVPGAGSDFQQLRWCPRLEKHPHAAQTPPWPNSWAWDARQIYSLCILDARTTLLGTRDVDTPVLLWDHLKSTLHELRHTWGTDGSGTYPGIERRVWAITRLGDSDTLAFGGQDGILRLADLDRQQLRLDSSSYPPLNLGSPVRALVTARVQGRELLCAASLRGEVFFFRVRRQGGKILRLELRSRDKLAHPVFDLAVTEDGRVFAIEQSGRVTGYHLRFGAGTHLGQRYLQIKAWHRGSCIAWLGHETLAIGGWDRERWRGLLRVIRLVDTDDKTWRDGQSRLHEQALKHLNRFTDQDSAVKLLCTVPISRSVLRTELGPEVASPLLRSETPEGLEAEFAHMLAGGQQGREQFKSVLDSWVARLGRKSVGAEPLGRLMKALVNPETGRSRFLGAHHAKARAAAVHKILTLPTLALWQQGGLQQKDLERWIRAHLHDESSIVRHETARSLATALGELLRLRDHPEQDDPDFQDRVAAVFPGPPALPLVARAGWLVELMARYLPASQRGAQAQHQVPALSVWAACSVLLNLLRLMPGACLVILDHLSIRRVDPEVFEVLGARLRRRSDGPILRKLERYHPWRGAPATRPAVLDYCKEIDREKLGISEAGGDPDHDYALAHDAVHGKALKDLVEVASQEGLKSLCNSWQPPGIRAAPEWACKLWDERQAFFQVTAGWLQELARVLAAEDLGETPFERLSRALTAGDRPLHRVADTLCEPERTVVRVILSHWLRLKNRDAPDPGGSLGPYELGDRFGGSPAVFKVAKGVDGDFLIATVLRISDDRAGVLVKAWKRLQELSAKEGSRLINVQDVVDERPYPGLVLPRLEGSNLHESWGPLLARFSDDPLGRLRLSHRFFLDVLGQLHELYDAELAHCDLWRRNIVYVAAEERFHLVDWEHLLGEHYPVYTRGEDDDYTQNRQESRHTETTAGVRRRTWQGYASEGVQRLVHYAGHLAAGKARDAGLTRAQLVEGLKDWPRTPLRGWVDFLAGAWDREQTPGAAWGSLVEAGLELPLANPLADWSPQEGLAGLLRRCLTEEGRQGLLALGQRDPGPTASLQDRVRVLWRDGELDTVFVKRFQTRVPWARLALSKLEPPGAGAVHGVPRPRPPSWCRDWKEAPRHLVFLSYVRTEAEPFAVDLAAALHARGLTLFWDREAQSTKHRVDDMLDGFARACGLFIGLVTAQYQHSRWTQNELGWAFDQDETKVLTVLLSEDDRHVPGKVRNRHRLESPTVADVVQEVETRLRERGLWPDP